MLDLRVFAASLAMLVASMSIALAEPARDQPSASCQPGGGTPDPRRPSGSWEPAKRPGRPDASREVIAQQLSRLAPLVRRVHHRTLPQRLVQTGSAKEADRRRV